MPLLGFAASHTISGVRSFFKIALTATSVVVAFAISELAVRILDVSPTFQVILRESIQPSDHPVLGYELRPGAPDGRRFRISSAGLRDREYSLQKPDAVFRIAAIGDSITYGMGIARGKSWVARLEDILNDRAVSGSPRFEVLNFGVPGYHIGQVVERLRVHGLPHEPDLILYGYALNDPQEFSIEAAALEGLRDAIHDHFRQPFGGDILRRWLSHSQFFLLARHFVTSGGPAKADALGPRLDPMYAAFERHAVSEYIRALHIEGESRMLLERGMEDLARLSGDAGVPLVVAVFPMFLDEDSGDYPVADVHALVGDEARRRGFAVIDLLEPLDAARSEADRPIHIDFLHPNALGNRAAARAMLEGLCDADLLPEGAVHCPAKAPSSTVPRSASAPS
jgi:lysophospholipase L1-like esterase